MAWSVPPHLVLESCGEEALVFHPGSGDTHHLNVVDRAALEVIHSRPGLTRAEIASAVAVALDTADDAVLRQYLAQLLDQFDELGLIISCDSCATAI